MSSGHPSRPFSDTPSSSRTAFYGALPEKSLNALTRIRSNGRHLLGLINTVLDIAKIEAGQFTLNMSEYAIESVVETVRAAAAFLESR
jgi:signal transduction histidine kinase